MKVISDREIESKPWGIMFGWWIGEGTFVEAIKSKPRGLMSSWWVDEVISVRGVMLRPRVTLVLYGKTCS